MTTRIMTLIALVLGLNVAAWFFEPASSNQLPVLDLALEAIDADQGARAFRLIDSAETGTRWRLERTNTQAENAAVIALASGDILAMASDGIFKPLPDEGALIRFGFESDAISLGDRSLQGPIHGELVIDRRTFSLEHILLTRVQPGDETHRVTTIDY